MKDKKDKAPAVYTVVQEHDLFAVHRNGRYLMTPAGHAFKLPTQKLADRIAQEWQLQGDKVDPTQIPMTQLAATALDIISKDRERLCDGLLAYISSELLCHRAELPESLTERQQELWQPCLDWCQQRYDIAFAVTTGIMPIKQSTEIVPRLRLVLNSYDDLRLSGLSSAIDSSGSFVLGLALSEGFKNAEEVFQAAELDFSHQAQKWGDDPVSLARQDSVRQDLIACEQLFGLLRP